MSCTSSPGTTCRSGCGPTRPPSRRRRCSSSATSARPAADRRRRRDAGRPRGHRRDRRLVIAMRGAVCPAAVGVDIGCGMSRGADLADRRRPAGRPGPAAVRIEAAIPVGRAASARRPGRPGAACRVSPARGWRRVLARFDGARAGGQARQARAAPSRWARSAAATTSSSSAWTPTGRVWLMLHSGSREHRQGAGRAPHRRRPRSCPTTRTWPTATWRCSSRTPRRWRPTAATCSGRRSTRKHNRAVMMALFQDVVRKEFRGRGRPSSRSISCHHNYVAEEVLRRRGAAGHPQGRDPGRLRATRHHPRVRWAPARTSSRAWATRRRSTRPRTAPGGG